MPTPQNPGTEPPAPPLQLHREQHGLTQRRVQVRSRFDRTYLSAIENGRRSPGQITTLARLAHGYRVSVDRMIRLIAETAQWKEEHGVNPARAEVTRQGADGGKAA